MNITIEKIENGYIVVLGAKNTFCSEAMGICGLLAEWAQAEVERLDSGPKYGDEATRLALSAAMAQVQSQLMQPPKMVIPDGELKKSLLGDWSTVKSIIDDQL